MWGAAPTSYRLTLLLALASVCACPVARATATDLGNAPPKRLAVVTRDASTVALRWRAPAGSRPARYVVRQNGRVVVTTTRQQAVIAGLRCKTRYELAVAAVDRRGRRSSWATLRTATRSCESRSGEVPAPVQELTVSRVAPTDVTIVWRPPSPGF